MGSNLLWSCIWISNKATNCNFTTSFLELYFEISALKSLRFFFWNRSCWENSIEILKCFWPQSVNLNFIFEIWQELKTVYLFLAELNLQNNFQSFFLSEEFGQKVLKILSNYLRLQIKDEGCVNQTLKWGKWLSKGLIFTIKGSSMMKIAISHPKNHNC